MRRLYMIGMRWAGPYMQTDGVDVLASQLGPWYRYNGDTWFVVTQVGADEIASRVRSAVGPENSVVVLPVDSSGPIAGWAPKSMWEILELRSPLVNALMAPAPQAPFQSPFSSTKSD